MKALTKRQQEILSFLEQFRDAHGYAPTVREAAAHFEISVKAIHDHFRALEKKGAIQSAEGKPRAMDICSSPREEMIEVPILGPIAAGTPIFAEENWEGSRQFPLSIFGRGQFFGLFVQGDSMQDAGILDGDLVILKQQNQANNGEIVVAQIDEGYTLKRFYKEANRVRLVSENPAYPNFYSNNVRILGKLVHLVRSYDP